MREVHPAHLGRIDEGEDVVEPVFTVGERQQGAGTQSSPTVILLDAAGTIVGVTEGGTALLDDLRTEGVDEQGVPTVIQAAATRARWS